MQLVDFFVLLALLVWGALSVKTLISSGLWKLPLRERAPIPVAWGLVLFFCFFPLSILLSQLFFNLGLSKQFLSPFVLCGIALFYFIFSLNPYFISLWRREGGQSFAKSAAAGAYGLFLLFPLVFLVEGFFTLIIENWLGYPRVDQDAIAYLLSLGSSPFIFVLIALLIFTVIPLMEELLFRGFLQNSLGGFLPKYLALPLTALIFTSFHFSMQQGASNFIILPSLFLLALGLSWVYDRTGNLLAPLAFHSLFNAVSVLMIISQMETAAAT